jgi:hypothetical protein
MIDGFSALADHRGECVLLVEAAPLPIVVQIDEMTQPPARVEEFYFGSLAIDVGRECLCHDVELGKKLLKYFFSKQKRWASFRRLFWKRAKVPVVVSHVHVRFEGIVSAPSVK